MAKKKSGFNLNNSATLIGFIIALIGTIVFNFYIGGLMALVTIVIYLIVNSKQAGNACIGALVGFLIGLLVHWLLAAVNIVLVNI